MSEHDYDLLDLDTHVDDPWPMYTYLREEEPLYWDRHNELWAISRHADIVAMSSDTETFTSGEGALANIPPDPSMIHQYPEQHGKQRRLVSSAFTPSRMRSLESNARDIAIDIIENVRPQGSCDAVTDLAKHLPLRLIGAMLGHPREDLEMIQSWTDAMVQGGSGPQYVDETTNDAFDNFATYHEEAIAKRMEERTDDILSVWLDAEIDGEKLDESQLLFEHALIFVGGSETTRNVMSCGIEMLIKNPEQRQYFIENIDDPAVNKAAIEEMIRWAVPFTRMVRVATRDVEMYGKTIKEGQGIMMMYPCAMRDPRVFDDPDTFDIRRPAPTSNLSFGHGRHLCLGANLARMELRIFFDELLRRIPNMEFDPAQSPTKRRSSFIRGLTSLPVVWDTAEG
ncbi:MAG: cytochrome P450 [Deltaproteobacteria bacterium]